LAFSDWVADAPCLRLPRPYGSGYSRCLDLAWGSGALSTPQAIVNGWMNSPGHRANILSCDSHDLGVGYVVDPNRGAIWTQLFGFG